MRSLLGATVIVAFFSASQAVNTKGDPTVLSNYPDCMQRCIPKGFGPPANCGSLSNLTCVCLTADFAHQLVACEVTTCSGLERNQSDALSSRLCASFGGFGPALNNEEASILATSQLAISATPTFPPYVTGLDQASSVLATATPAPYYGNPAAVPLSSVYPTCAETCADETADLLYDPNSLNEFCGVEYRTGIAICEAAVCSNAARQLSQVIAQDLCRPFYRYNPELGSSVIASVNSATPIAQAAVANKNATNHSVYPDCAQNCQNETNFTECGTLDNHACVCGNSTAAQVLDTCERSTCSPEDYIRTRALAYQLCASVATAMRTVAAGNGSNGTSNDTVIPFTGAANALLRDGGVLVSFLLALLSLEGALVPL